MDRHRRLARNLTSESKAYGYTLCIWGGGSVLARVVGAPTVLGTFCYVGGALLAFGTVLVVAFDDVVTDPPEGDATEVPSMLHLLATGGSLLLALLLSAGVERAGLPTAVAYALCGFQLTLSYNLLLPVETAAVEWVVGEPKET
jgi:hypothetical protein